jgi:hypothetical protein
VDEPTQRDGLPFRQFPNLLHEGYWIGCLSKATYFWNGEIGQDSRRKLKHLQRQPADTFWNALEVILSWGVSCPVSPSP